MSIQKESLVDIAIKRIKQHIAASDLKPNDKYLSEKELVSQLQVSRTVVREALISLQSVGILKIKPGGGVYIDNPNLDAIKGILKHHYDTHGVKIRELVEIRKVVELGALRLIIEKDVPVDFQQLQAINDSYYQAVIHNGDTRKADRLFHQFLIKATNNETFYHFSEIIHEYFSLAKMDMIQNEALLLPSHEQHEAIIDSLKVKDLYQAQQTMIQHLEPIFVFTNQMEADTQDGTHSIS
ncbi:FadR/GntR family transcriptional regulator [Virgibacillus halophilus]|uniref:FCD domain-containing protein n=1 Tax=Tigheibacillus halophilus TaxID=361280 RepID=A0ABU5C5T3_9BACI|nr:FCD domain-containing protein [Virgibacillus halophilus]